MKSNGNKSAANIVRTLLCGSMLAILPQAAHAQDVPEGEMINIGGPDSSSSHANGLSSDGGVIIGHLVYPDVSGSQAFRWTSAGGAEALGTLGGDYSYAYGLSDDGSVIVGFSTQGGNYGYNRAFRWTSASGMVGLDLPEGYYSKAYAVSGDGAITVGEAAIAGRYDGYSEAVRLTDTGPCKSSDPWAV